MQLFYSQNIDNNTVTLNEEESKHAVRVLRKTVGDSLTVIDGLGSLYRCEILDAHPKHTLCTVVERIDNFQPLNYNLHIAIAPTKVIDRIEWFLEKATEIGVGEITMLRCDRSERKVVKIDRLEKVVVSAMKQSIKARKPQLNDMVSFADFISSNFEGYDKFIAHCNESNDTCHLKKLLVSNPNIVVMIGPEGDFSPNEVAEAKKRGFKEISLGEERLRTETAALYATTTVALHHIR